MSVSWFFTNLLAAFLLPPLSLVILGCLGWWLAKRFRFAGNTIIITSIALLLVLSTGAGSRLLVAPLENRSLPVPNPKMVNAQAIVILEAAVRLLRLKMAVGINPAHRHSRACAMAHACTA